MEWNLENAACWEHLLPGEPTELRKECPVTDDIDPLTREEELSKEKHLDMPITWVKQLHIGNPGKKNVTLPPPLPNFPVWIYFFFVQDFEERYPNGEKIIHFMRAIYERFAPYHKKSGMVSRLTTYTTLDYQEALMRWEWYENRQDLLQIIKINFTTKQLEEYFVRGRPDFLKCMADIALLSL